MTTMEEARKAVDEFLAKAGHHDTTVTERVAPAIYHETITKNELEETTTVIDKEIHQDHYHISVQPIDDEESNSEEHHHKVAEVEHREFQHDDLVELQAKLAEEAGKFKDEVIRVEGKRSNAVRPVIAAEHIHHHVHELIQPVVNKRTVDTHIIHTTVPIHEVHHNAAHHHATSALPAVSMADFKKQGGVLIGREERYDFFEGEPRSVGKALGGGSNAAASARPIPSQAKGSTTSSGAATTPAAPAVAKPTASAAPTSPGQPAQQPAQSGFLEAPAVTTPHPNPSPPIAPPRTPTFHPSQALTAPPTFLPKHTYVRSHPAGTTGARPTPPPRPASASGAEADKPKPEQS